MSGLRNPLQSVRGLDQGRELRSEVCLRSGIAMLEPQAGHARVDVIVEAAHVGDDGGAAGGHRFERSHRQRLAELSETRIDEDGALAILANERVLIEDRADEFAPAPRADQRCS